MRRPARVALALLALALCGCASGPAPRDHYYRLEAGAPSGSGAPLDGAVEVDRLRTDAITDQLPVLYRVEGRVEIRQHQYHRWVSPPTTMVQNELISFLRAAQAAPRVVRPEARVGAPYRVTGRLSRLERVLEGESVRVVVELELALTRDRLDVLILETYRAERQVEGALVDDSVAAFDAALSEAFAGFLADLRRVAS